MNKKKYNPTKNVTHLTVLVTPNEIGKNKVTKNVTYCPFSSVYSGFFLSRIEYPIQNKAWFFGIAIALYPPTHTVVCLIN